MASHRRPKQAGRARVTVFTATAAAAVALAPQAVQAAPKPTVKEVQAEVDKFYEQAEQATEKYDGAKEKQSKLQKQVGNLQDEVARQQEELNGLQDGLGSLACAQYRSAGIDPSVQLFLSANPDDYLEKASTLDQLTTKQADTLKQIQAKKRTLDQQRSEAAGKLVELDDIRTELAKKKKEIQGKLAKARKLLNSLTAAQRSALAEEQARANGFGIGIGVDLGGGSSATKRAAAALAAAKAKLGSPYIYGASGPNSFDCSGLTSWAYAHAGVSIPRTSESQAGAGRILTLGQLRPGDLVIFYRDHHHVALYAGHGMVLHAPKPNAAVRYEAIGNMPFQFGVRI